MRKPMPRLELSRRPASSAVGGSEDPLTVGSGGGGGDGEDGDEPSSFAGKAAKWWSDPENQADVKSYVSSLSLALLFRFFVMEPRFIPSLSMFPTFDIGDQLAVEKVSHFVRPYSRNDVVVFTPPQSFIDVTGKESYRKEALIKRVVATEGDVVEIKDKGTLYVNGVAQAETFTYEKAFYNWGPQQVPEGMLMVLGDNRNHSLDSHVWGFLPKENIIGRALFKYWPVWRAGVVESSAVNLQ